MEITELKNTVSFTHTHKLVGWLSSPVEMTEDRISELKNKSVGIIQEFT